MGNVKIKSRNIPYILIIFVAAMCLSGFSNITERDIEAAIIRQDFELAKRLSEELLRKKSSQKGTYYLGLTQLRLGQYSGARDIFQKLIQVNSSERLRDRAYLGLFDTYYMEESYENALKTGQDLLELSPKSEYLSLIYFKLGRANLKQAHWSKAHDYLKKIVYDFPRSMEVPLAKKLLEEKQYFAVQVGAFMARGSAEKLISELKQKRQYAYIVETLDPQNRKFYRVRIGKLSVLDKAKRLKFKLSRQGYPATIYP